jgi:hypothetical protein
MSNIFRFRGHGEVWFPDPSKPSLGKPKSRPALTLDFTLPKPSTGKPDPVVERMLQEGMVALPDDLQGLSREELAERGYHFVKWHARYKRRYVPLRVKRHDT